jgi:nicotinamidase-related amidase
MSILIPEVNSSCLIVVDMQEKLVKAMHLPERCIESHQLLLKAASLLNLDILVTEQYPKGLGHTIPELKELFSSKYPIIEKSAFSCFGEPEFKKALTAKKIKSLIITGIESHVCVQQTVLDALAEGYQVFVPADTLTSRNIDDYNLSLKLMRQAGAVVTSTESLIFMLTRTSKHAQFREISKLIK